MPQEPLSMDAGMVMEKVIVCSELLVAAIVDIGPLKTIALCRPGAESWLVSRFGSKRIIRDVMLYEGKLYALDGYKDLLVIIVGKDNDNGKLSISRIDHFLVECNGALLLLSRTIFGKLPGDATDCTSAEPVGVEFDVFKADFHSSGWEAVTNVGDEWALFVSKSYSKSVSVSDQHNKLKGNSICFLADGTLQTGSGRVRRVRIVYDLSDGETYPPVPNGSFKSEKAPAAWLFPH